jgi:transposase
VQNYLTLYRTTGSIEPRPHAGGIPPKIDERGLQQVGALLERTPDATVDELSDDFARCSHIAVGRSTMDRALHRLEVTRKKKRSMRPSATRPSALRRGELSPGRS